MSNTKTIAKNAGWYGLENIISFATLATSIAIARTLGPSETGYLIYVIWIASVVSSLGGIGLPETTRKYMAEFIGMGDRGTARFIYIRTMLMQICLATVATSGIVFWVFRFGNPDYRLASLLVAVSIWPAMVNFISAQANVATENLFTNLPASIISTFVYLGVTAATVVFHWGMVGVGAAMLSMRVVDFLIRLIPTMMRIMGWEKVHAHPPELAARMMRFAGQSVATMLLALIVWNRSEVVLLKHMCSDIRQIAYYSVAFSLAERLLITSQVFGSATGATIFAQYGRDKTKLPSIAASSIRYLALSSIPVHFIASALAVPALLLLYGDKYNGASAVVTLAPLLCLPKAFIVPVQNLLESAERQVFVILATVLAGVVDFGVAAALIPGHGAVGACIGSGAAQIVAVGLMWTIGIRMFKIRIAWGHVAKVTIIGILAALTAHYTAVRFVHPLWSVLLGSAAALFVFFTLVYLLRVLEPQDRDRFNALASMLPSSIVRPGKRILALLVRSDSRVAEKSLGRFPMVAEKGKISPAIVDVYRQHLPLTFRSRVLDMRKSATGIKLKMKLVPIRVEACLRGGDNGVSAATFARLKGDIRRASLPVSEWPHVKLLRRFDQVRDQLWDPGVFEQTEYYQNALFNIDFFGRYFDAFSAEQIHLGARRFVNAYSGQYSGLDDSGVPSYFRDPYEYVSVAPIKSSNCYSVIEGHHRLALAYMKGVREVKGLVVRPEVTTPLQDLLLDVMWLKGKRELYQPINSPEVAGWVLIRRCTDRLAKMAAFLHSEGLMPPEAGSYLDIACSYGWFVAQMEKAGFRAEGVERDPTAITVGQLMYGLRKGQVHRSDAVRFLRTAEQKYDVTSCFSLVHHYMLNEVNVSAEEVLRLADAVTGRVMFFDMGQSHEYAGPKLAGWGPDRIRGWLEENTTFSRIVPLGADEDAVGPNRRNFGRMLFACVR